MTVESPPAIKRLDHIQALRGIAALMVVVSHLLIIEQKYSADQILGDWASYGMAGVDLFFVISGFIMVYVMWDRPRGIKAAGEFLWGRAVRIYPLYWLVSLVLLGLWLIRPDMVFSSIEVPPDILKSLALFPDEREPLLAVGWTLVHEMYFYLVFAGIMLLPRKALLPCLFVWMVIIFVGDYFAIKTPLFHPVLAVIFSPLTFEFILGAFAGWTLRSRYEDDSSPISYLWIYGTILFALISFSNGFREAKFPVDQMDRVDDFFIFGTLTVFALAALDFRNETVWKPLVTLGDWSYSLYLTHVLSLTVMGRIWSYFKNDSLLDNAAVLLLMVAITIIIAGLVYHFAERPMINATKKMRRRLFVAPPA